MERKVDHYTIEVKVHVEHRVPLWTLAFSVIMLVLANLADWSDLLSWLIP